MKKIIITFLVFILFLFGVLTALRLFVGGGEDTWICVAGQWIKHGKPSAPKPQNGCGKKEILHRLPALPKTGDITEYVQSKQADLDGDGVSEAVAIYYYSKGDEADEYEIYKIFFVIFKLKDNRWVKVLDQRLEDLSESDLRFFGSKMTIAEYAQQKNQFSLADLTADNLPEVLVQTQSEGTGRYLGAFIYGLKNGQIQELWSAVGITKGVVGIEKDKVWLIMPNYGPADPNCCPGEWVKSWWGWQKERDKFKMMATVKENSLEKIKSIPYSETVEAKSESIKVDSSGGFGIIKGSLSYPSEGIPSDLAVCAQNQETKKLFCTDEHLEDAKYQYHYGYKLEVPPGQYLVYAQTIAQPGYKAYFSEHVICGSLASCPSHEPVVVTIKANATISNIDPGDWYK